MDLKGSLVDTNIKIYLNETAIKFIKAIPVNEDLPQNIAKIIDVGYEYTPKKLKTPNNISPQIIVEDLENLNKIKEAVNVIINDNEPQGSVKSNEDQEKSILRSKTNDKNGVDDIGNLHTTYICLPDVDWLYDYIKSKHNDGDTTIPYLHTLLEGCKIEMPKNEVLKRNPVLEARCIKLRAQQEAREYRKMTKGVDNVRIKFPEDSISYQLKQVNRQLIAVGQFIISIFAGFLFGFRGVEWMVGNLDFGFRLLLGVMCALVIALAEIYFLAKKLNEELNIPETVQLGGPPKFVNGENTKHHQD